MLMRHFAVRCMLLTAGLVGLPAHSAHAGPLIDWLFHKHSYGPAVPVGAPYPVTAGYAPAAPYATGYVPYSTGYVPYTTGYTPYSVGYAPAPARVTTGYGGYTGYTPYGVAYPSTGYRPTTGNLPPQSSYPLPTYGTYYGSTAPVIGSTGYGYLTQKPANDALVPTQYVAPPTNPVTLVPDYRSTYARTPVTYYRPVLTTDPNSGSQVVALAPCTSYEYQTQRVPTWGLTQVYNGGATLPAVAPTAPIVSPTISLPRGGVPLAGPLPGTQPYSTAYGAYPTTSTSMVAPVIAAPGSPISPAAPSTSAPYTSGYSSYASNYGNYSTLQPGAALPSTSTYSTQPISPYYGNGISGATGSGSTGSGSTGGGSTGSYSAPPTYSNAPYGTTAPGTINPSYPSTPVPGSVYPGAPYNGQPLNTAPLNTAPLNTPPLSAPSTAPVFPSGPTRDPASIVPTLPPGPLSSNTRSDAKPQLQNIVQQPVPTTRSFTPSPGPAAQPADSKPNLDNSQGLLPIPLPSDFKHEPRWNPGLLKENDTTAAVTRPTDAQVAWGSKTIRWASHKTTTGKNSPELDLPPAKLRERPINNFQPPVTEIPEVGFAAPLPARLELEEADAPRQVEGPRPAENQAIPPANPQIDPKGRRTDIWQKAK